MSPGPQGSPLANLRAIEAQAYDRLPADPFAKGMVVLYATHLGLDGPEPAAGFWRNAYWRGHAKRRPSEPGTFSALLPKKLAEPSHLSSAAVAMALLMIIVLSFTLFCLSTSWNPFAFLTERVLGDTAATGNSFHPADPATGNGGQRRTLHLGPLSLGCQRGDGDVDGHRSPRQRYSGNTSATWSARTADYGSNFPA